MVVMLAHQGHSRSLKSQFWLIEASQSQCLPTREIFHLHKNLSGWVGIGDVQWNPLLLTSYVPFDNHIKPVWGTIFGILAGIRITCIVSSSTFNEKDLALLYQESMVVMNSFAMAAHVLPSRVLLKCYSIRKGSIITKSLGEISSTWRQEPEEGKTVFVFFLSVPSSCLPSVSRVLLWVHFKGILFLLRCSCNLSIRLCCSTQEGRK